MSASVLTESQQRPSSLDGDVVFVASVSTVQGAMRAYGVMRTRVSGLGGVPTGCDSVTTLGSSVRRVHSPSSDDEHLFCLDQVVAGKGKFIPCCIP